MVYNSLFLQLHAWLPSLWKGVWLKVTLIWYKHCCFLNTNYFVSMLTWYWSLSQQGHLQPHSKSKAWQLSTQLYNGLLGLTWKVDVKSTFSLKVSYKVNLHIKKVIFCLQPYILTQNIYRIYSAISRDPKLCTCRLGITRTKNKSKTSGYWPRPINYYKTELLTTAKPKIFGKKLHWRSWMRLRR